MEQNGQGTPKVASPKRQSTARHSHQPAAGEAAPDGQSGQPAFKSTLPGAMQLRQMPLSQPGRAEDLPKIWDAPGAQDDRAIKRDTKPLPRDQPSANPTNSAAGEPSLQPDPLDELIQSYAQQVPTEDTQAAPAEASAVSASNQDPRQSGGWGDELFGDAGRNFEAQEPKAATASLPQQDRSQPYLEQPGPEVRPINERKSVVYRFVWPVIAVMIVATCTLWAYLLSQSELPSSDQAAHPSLRAEDEQALNATAPPKPQTNVDAKAPTPTLDEEAEDDKPNLSFRARLSPEDHRSPSGDKLTVAWQVLVRDRDRFHAGQGDPEDSEDSRFRDEAGRKRLIYLLKHRRLSTESQHAIKGGFPLVEVRIWDEQVTVEVLGE